MIFAVLQVCIKHTSIKNLHTINREAKASRQPKYLAWKPRGNSSLLNPPFELYWEGKLITGSRLLEKSAKSSKEEFKFHSSSRRICSGSESCLSLSCSSHDVNQLVFVKGIYGIICPTSHLCISGLFEPGLSGPGPIQALWAMVAICCLPRDFRKPLSLLNACDTIQMCTGHQKWGFLSNREVWSTGIVSLYYL